MIGYPSKSTHGLQGLDRVHFGRAKALWPLHVRQFADEHGYQMRKEDFLRVLNGVWTEVFTAENNRRAFVVTGLTRPVQPERISSRMMAPSQETSTQSSFPIPQSTPIRNAARLIAVVSDLDSSTPTRSHVTRETEIALNISPASMAVDPNLFTPQKRQLAIARHVHLAKLDLPTRCTISSSSHPLSPQLAQPPDVSDIGYRTPSPLPLESDDPAVLQAENRRLQANLQQAQHTMRVQNSQLHGQNAQLLLQNEHCLGLQKQLNQKGKRKKNSHLAKYLSDAGPGRRVFTSVEFRDAIRRDQKAAEKKDLAKFRREVLAAAKRRRNQWREEQKEKRRAENERVQKEWEDAVTETQIAGGSGHQALPKKTRARKAKTPERYTHAVEQAERLTDEDASTLQDIIEDGLSKDDRRQAILEALEQMDLDIPDSDSSMD